MTFLRSGRRAPARQDGGAPLVVPIRSVTGSRTSGAGSPATSAMDADAAARPFASVGWTTVEPGAPSAPIALPPPADQTAQLHAETGTETEEIRKLAG